MYVYPLKYFYPTTVCFLVAALNKITLLPADLVKDVHGRRQRKQGGVAPLDFHTWYRNSR